MPAKRVLIGVIAGVVLVVSVMAIFRQARGPSLPSLPTSEWYWDLNTRQLFSAPLGQIPPITAPSGASKDGSLAGVRAHVFGCGDCSEAKRFVAYLETYTPEVKQRLLEFRENSRSKERPRAGPELNMGDVMIDTNLRMGTATVVKRVDDPDCVPMKSEEGQRIVQEALRRCGGKDVARPCSPTK